MDAKQALSDLTEISSQIRAAVLIESDGTVAAATLEGEAAERMARAAQELLFAAERTRPGLGPGTLCQLEVATLEGSVFAIRDHGRVIAATTGPEPTVGLVFYDLKSCLRDAAQGKASAPAAKRRVRAGRGPGEGNREVPSTSTEADDTKADDASEAKAAPKTPRRRTTKKDDDAAS
jgi:predicted regulator of Ras-like GTPase activity (Roadblock/LC7/MglB family)